MGHTELLENLDLLNSLYQQLEGQLKQQQWPHQLRSTEAKHLTTWQRVGATKK